MGRLSKPQKTLPSTSNAGTPNTPRASGGLGVGAAAAPWRVAPSSSPGLRGSSSAASLVGAPASSASCAALPDMAEHRLADEAVDAAVLACRPRPGAAGQRVERVARRQLQRPRPANGPATDMAVGPVPLGRNARRPRVAMLLEQRRQQHRPVRPRCGSGPPAPRATLEGQPGVGRDEVQVELDVLHGSSLVGTSWLQGGKPSLAAAPARPDGQALGCCPAGLQARNLVEWCESTLRTVPLRSSMRQTEMQGEGMTSSELGSK
jgi:hypothetical protein